MTPLSQVRREQEMKEKLDRNLQESGSMVSQVTNRFIFFVNLIFVCFSF